MRAGSHTFRSSPWATAALAACALLMIVAGGRRAPLASAEDVQAEDAQAAKQNAQQELAGSFDTAISPFLVKYCTECHSGDLPEADLSLDKYETIEQVVEDRDRWDIIQDMIATRTMPPEEEGQARPSEEEYTFVGHWLEAKLSQVDCTGPVWPGRVTLRRLNRAEYNNTIRDLLGVDVKPADDFPSDDVGYGFDNIGDVLSMSPILFEKYMAAAGDVLDEVFSDEALRNRVLTTRPEGDRGDAEAAKTVLARFASRAFRRPVEEHELERLLAIAELARKEEASYEQQVQLAMQATLTSPYFLFRVEQDPEDPQAVRELNDYELATRLSYFLWSSMPDETLFELASQGKLQEPAVREQQVRRMLADPKSESLTRNFAAQWLQLRDVDSAAPDPQKYPEFDDALRSAMKRETELFFESIVREDPSILDFIDSDYTFVNERLARHYGIEGIEGDQFRKVSLSGRRGGVLTQGSILLLTSNPTRTSPVKRGKWIMSNILGTPPLPPPEGVEELSEDEGAELLGSLRERMEQHRANPVCASCHNRMDPLGFGFENFDAIGSWRTEDGRFEIDASGELPGGQSFDGPAELRSILRETKAEQFCRCFAEKLLTYALGRGLESYDRCSVDRIIETAGKDDFRFSSLVLAVVESEPFLKRGGTGGKP